MMKTLKVHAVRVRVVVLADLALSSRQTPSPKMAPCQYRLVDQWIA